MKIVTLVLISLILSSCSKNESQENSGIPGSWNVTSTDCQNSFSKIDFTSESTFVTDNAIKGTYNFKNGSEFLNNYWINAGFPDRAVYNKANVNGQYFSISNSNDSVILKNEGNSCSTILVRDIN